MRGSAAGHLAGAGSGIAAVTVKLITTRLAAPLPASLAKAPTLPFPGKEGDGTDWLDRPGDVFVHSINDLLALPGLQHGLPNVVEACCSVSVVELSINALIFSFLLPAPVRPSLP